MAQTKTFFSKWSPFLFRILIGALILAIVIVAGLLVKTTVFDKRETPRTAAERAIMDAEAEVAKAPRSAEARFDLGNAYAMAGRYSAALRELRMATQLKPKFPKPYFSMGVIYKEEGNLEMAIKYLKKTTTLKGEYAEFYAQTYYELGQAYFAQKKYNAAIDAYEKAVGYAPMASDIRYDLAGTYEKAGLKKEALDEYDIVLQYDPQNKNAKKAYERLDAELKKKPEDKSSEEKQGK
jgi:tetratricopeptide (TPR) repeat protein